MSGLILSHDENAPPSVVDKWGAIVPFRGSCTHLAIIPENRDGSGNTLLVGDGDWVVLYTSNKRRVYTDINFRSRFAPVYENRRPVMPVTEEDEGDFKPG